MSVTPEEIAFARDLFSDAGDITTRRMFGGMALYCEGTVFAILRSDGELLIKGAGPFAEALEAMGCTRWTYTRKNGTQAAMPYWTLPPEAQDDPEAASDLARRALAHL
ncbi:TfoX/Sxy family protein [Allosediminivita pacifica]|uniref:DNA transformation protein n=1 Tax=Allosediminivita pacifica TaxID=1267769 RepID=A0A2T6AV99_9RHOB|nr:TfoX/Sxy family protein [Allosediminivita pacifica]PTX47744.1 DNA transformation protein [Allosediminivita pacifica]GGB13180.1 competence protein TfoX [Allosediminivita pacifica]